MNANDFLNQLQHDSIVAAIRAAELQTSGEIRVFVSRKNVSDAVTAAQAEFARLEMHRTRERNGVLIYVAPLSQTFAVIGDRACIGSAGNRSGRSWRRR
ncbi:MAG: TPM domain-containing protein [Verrucomicrobiota bacterium]